MASKTAALIMCAGKGVRTGLRYNKLFYRINGKAVVEYTIEKFLPFNCRIIAVCAPEDADNAAMLTERFPRVEIVYGGATRSESVFNGLKYLKNCSTVIIHDGARPFVSAKDIQKSIELAGKNGSAVAYSRSSDTVKLKSQGMNVTPVDRDNVMCIKTPQTFRFSQIMDAYTQYFEEPTSPIPTDDSSIYDRMFEGCTYFECSVGNIKITTSADLDIMKGLLGSPPPLDKTMDSLRTGCGYDVHRLYINRPLILGGVQVPHTYGLLGHSDADVLTHALMDAILSACSLRDIGYYFPPDDDKYKNADSLNLLAEVMRMATEAGCRIINASCRLNAEAPRLSPFVPDMCQNLSRVLNLPKDRVCISATTWEGVGHIGKKQAISAHATVLIQKTK